MFAGKINLGNAMRTFDKKRERERDRERGGRGGDAALREKNWEEERRETRNESLKHFFPTMTTAGMCGTLVDLSVRAFIGRYMLGPFFVDMHTTDDDDNDDEDEKKSPQLRPFLWGTDGRARRNSPSSI